MKKVFLFIIAITFICCNSSDDSETNNIVPVPTVKLGDNYEGGIVAYIFLPGDPGYVAGQVHGLIAAAYDQSDGTAAWWDAGQDNVLIGSTSDAIGSGAANTSAIVAFNNQPNVSQICFDLVINSKNDWYLPSINELNTLYSNKNYIGGFNDAVYWSSSEYDINKAKAITFPSGQKINYSKAFGARARAIRSF